jgi:hypothetical protein
MQTAPVASQQIKKSLPLLAVANQIDAKKLHEHASYIISTAFYTLCTKTDDLIQISTF